MDNISNVELVCRIVGTIGSRIEGDPRTVSRSLLDKIQGVSTAYQSYVNGTPDENGMDTFLKRVCSITGLKCREQTQRTR